MQGRNTEVARRRESGRSTVEGAESGLGKRLVAEERKPAGNEGRKGRRDEKRSRLVSRWY